MQRILLVDDHPIIRQGLRLLLEREPDLQVIAEASDERGAIESLASCEPDLAIVDLALPRSSGLDLIRRFAQERPRMAVVVLSMYEEEVFAERAFRAGARGYVTKERGAEQVVAAVRAVLAGRVFLSEQTAARLLTARGASRRAGPAIDRLSDRELEVFQLIGGGLRTREIAARLGVSVKTIESHREHMKTKLGLGSGAALLRHAIQWTSLPLRAAEPEAS